MSKEEPTINFNELNSSKIIEGTEFVYIVKEGNTKKYKIVDTKEKILEYSLNKKNYAEKQVGILVTCECNNISGFFHNTIFLEKFKMDYYSNNKIDDLLYLNFNNCYFFKDIEAIGGDYKEIVINESIIEKNMYTRFINCEKLNLNNAIFKKNAILENSEIGKINANTSKFEENLLFQEVTVLNDFILDKIKGNKDLGFIDCRFEGFSKLELDISGELNFSHCSFYKKSEINFDEISGKFSLYKTNFSDKCYLEYELLENKKYKPLIFKDDFKKTKWNFLILAEIYKSSGRTEQYLETFYYFKKYERLEKKNKNKYKLSLLDYAIEITTKYYTSWKRTLLSMAFIIIAFFLLYCSFPNLLMYQNDLINSKNLFSIVFEMYKNSNFDIYLLIRKFGNILYFTIMTFTTVGYGDIIPLNWMKLAIASESFFGIFFTSSFVVTLSRRFL
ncbi:potassium channel family protein [Clostridium uliginosum]|uniref:Ion channel n=1 Tax=Clostridium uliginosum TaxID=119641 RepID=A0A1I1P614_9CLOT|nr:potassium channel family protein [Clostridium uliginosum]SFD05052.1 Ion channel [Clostridium uliginosum]